MNAVTAEGVDPDVLANLDAAGGVARRLDAGADIPNADIRNAVDDVVAVFDEFRHPSDRPRVPA